MKDALTNAATVSKRRAQSAATAAGAALLAAAIATSIALATGNSSANPPVHHGAAQLGARIVAKCAPDDTRPIGPDNQGVPACFSRSRG